MSCMGIDLFIVGRGIYQNDNPIRMAKKYREECWYQSIEEI